MLNNSKFIVEGAEAPRKKGLFWRALAVVLVVLAGLSAAYLKFTPHGRDTAEMISSATTMLVTAKTDPNLIFEDVGGDHVNVLLIGRDVNYKPVYDKKGRNIWHKPESNDNARSDSMIVVTLDKNRNVIRMVSLPRDAIVHLPPNDFHVRKAKLNAAHAYGGPPLLIKTLHDELGLTIHRYAVIKFDGFKKLIDEVGGVEVKVEGALKHDRATGKLYRGNLDYDDNWGNLHIHLKPGLQRLNGEQAHNYVRFREDLEGDPGRIRRQQGVMRALAKTIMQEPIYKIPGLVKEVKRQFQTDMSDSEIASMADFAKSVGDAAKIQPLTLFGTFNTRGSLTLNKPKNEKLLSYVFGPTFDSANFLNRSPSTNTDEIGPTNDANPAAMKILREAGVVDAKDPMPEGFTATVPVKNEPEKYQQN